MVSELIDIAGARNVFPELPIGRPAKDRIVSADAVREAAPT